MSRGPFLGGCDDTHQLATACGIYAGHNLDVYFYLPHCYSAAVCKMVSHQSYFSVLFIDRELNKPEPKIHIVEKFPYFAIMNVIRL